MEAWRQWLLGGRKNLVQQKEKRFDLTPTGFLMEGDFTCNGLVTSEITRICGDALGVRLLVTAESARFARLVKVLRSPVGNVSMRFFDLLTVVRVQRGIHCAITKSRKLASSQFLNVLHQPASIASSRQLLGFWPCFRKSPFFDRNVADFTRRSTQTAEFSDNPRLLFRVQVIRIIRSSFVDRRYNLPRWARSRGRSGL